MYRNIVFNNELELLKAFGAAMDSIVVSDIVLAGHNIKKFDLPKLRTRTLYSKLSLPLILKPQQLQKTPQSFRQGTEFLKQSSGIIR